MLDTEFAYFKEEGNEKWPIFRVIRPFHRWEDKLFTLEECMDKCLSYPIKYKKYHKDHDFSYKYNEDIAMCCCGEEKEWDPNDLDEPAYGSEKE